MVAEDHEEFRRTLELLGDLLEEERGERHVPALPPHSAREEWSRVLVFRTRRHLERDFFSHMQVRACVCACVAAPPSAVAELGHRIDPP